MMTAVFADTCYFLALGTPRDRLHRQAVALQAWLNKPLLTTEWVLTEVADALAAPATRARFAALMDRLSARRDVRIASMDHEHFKKGCALYLQRMDKGWSLTDCISFLIMWQRGVKTALTTDQHFVQAGFQILMDAEPSGVREPGPLYGAEEASTACCAASDRLPRSPARAQVPGML